MNGFPDREPCLPPIALSDMAAGLYGAFAVAASVPRARESGRGELVDLSLFESLFSILGPTAETFLATGAPQPRDGSRTPYSAPRNVYRTSDGRWIAVSAATQATAERLFHVMDAAWLLGDPRFATNQQRAENADALDAIVGGFFAGLTLEAALATLSEAGVTAEAVSTVADLMDGPYFASREILLAREGSDGRQVRMHNVVPRLANAPGAVCRRAPRLGEHNDELLRPLATPEEWARISPAATEVGATS
jgi:crotonobetainyl-CoA:carnitine CoA-transferase CaiB-like acyl-CoA transferase